jgi:hypothetical protein
MRWWSENLHAARAAVFTVTGLALVMGCGGGRHAGQQAQTDTLTDSALAALTHPTAPEQPKVPFGNQPCQSLSEADETTLGMTQPIRSTGDRAPATLPNDNMCSYLDGGSLAVQVAYHTADDYQMNKDTNHSTSRPDPAGLPGGFYDKQGEAWFTTNGYYVVVRGESRGRAGLAGP